MPVVRIVAARRLRTYFVVIRKFLRKILGVTRRRSRWVPKELVGKVLLRLRRKSEFSDQSLRIPLLLGLPIRNSSINFSNFRPEVGRPASSLNGTKQQVRPFNLVTSQVGELDPVPAPSLNGIQT